MTGDSTIQIPELEHLCHACCGRGGSENSYGQRFVCAECNGAGYVPTSFGEKILEFMRHNLRPILDDSNTD